MLRNFKTSQKVLFLIVCCSILIPCISIPFANASTYATETAIVQVRTQNSAGVPMCTIQLYTQADTYDPGSGNWRILHYYSGIFNQYHFMWVPVYWWIFIVDWETRYVYDILDIDWYEFTIPYLGTVIAGSTWTFKLYERRNTNNWFIFELHAYVVAGGGTDVGFNPVSSSSNGWRHFVEEIDWNEHVSAFLGEWLENNPA
ncbi:MAG: hypothetical protein ACFFDF_02845 [Candidatus Odinarchaeota archaeon]